MSRTWLLEAGDGSGHHVIWGAAVVFVLPAQSSLAPLFEVWGVVPDLPLLCVLIFGLTHGLAAAAIVGMLIGAGLDTFSGGTVVFYTVVDAGLGVAASLVGRVTANVQTTTVLAVAASGSLLLQGIQVVWFRPFDAGHDMIRWMAGTLLPQIVYTTGLGGMVYLLWTWRRPVSRTPLKDQHDFFTTGRFPGSLR